MNKSKINRLANIGVITDGDKKYEMMQTKVRPEVYARVKRIMKLKGLTDYQLLQMMVDCIDRYMSDKHNLTPEMEKAMSIFEHMEGWANALNLADPSVKKKIGEATYFLYDPEGKKKGTRAVHVMQPSFGNWEETINIQDILERTICLLMPERYTRLRKLAVDFECKSILELIDHLIDAHSEDADVEFFRQAFEDADRSEYGREMWKQPFKRHPHKDPYFQQLNLNFDKDGSETEQP